MILVAYRFRRRWAQRLDEHIVRGVSVSECVMHHTLVNCRCRCSGRYRGGRCHLDSYRHCVTHSLLSVQVSRPQHAAAATYLNTPYHQHIIEFHRCVFLVTCDQGRRSLCDRGDMSPQYL